MLYKEPASLFRYQEVRLSIQLSEPGRTFVRWHVRLPLGVRRSCRRGIKEAGEPSSCQHSGFCMAEPECGKDDRGKRCWNIYLSSRALKSSVAFLLSISFPLAKIDFVGGHASQWCKAKHKSPFVRGFWTGFFFSPSTQSTIKANVPARFLLPFFSLPSQYRSTFPLETAHCLGT